MDIANLSVEEWKALAEQVNSCPICKDNPEVRELVLKIWRTNFYRVCKEKFGERRAKEIMYGK